MEEIFEDICWSSQTITERAEILIESNTVNCYTDNSKNIKLNKSEQIYAEYLGELYDIVNPQGLVRQCKLRSEWPSDIELPSWINHLNKTLFLDANIDDTPIEINDWAFGKLYTKWATNLSINLESNSINPPKKLKKSLLHWLCRRYAKIIDRPLYREYRVYKLYKIQKYEMEQQSSKEWEPQIRCEFLNKIQSDSWIKNFFQTYPMALRYILTISKQWEDFYRQVCSHLDNDWDDLSSILSTESQDIEFTDISILSSETHHCGKSPILFQTKSESENNVIYKPRDVSVDSLIYGITNDLLEWGYLNNNLKVLRKGNYGWVEEVVPNNCTKSNCVSKYYKNSGRLIATSYIYNMNDLHYENIIANQEIPVIIDGETIYQPPSFEFLQKKIWNRVDQEVIASGLLPIEIGTRSSPGQNISGIDIPRVQISSSSPVYLLEQFKKEENPNETYNSKRDTISDPKNVPYQSKTQNSIEQYLCEIVEGFIDVFESKCNIDVLAEKTHHEWNFESRILFRPTQTYSSVINKSLKPEILESGIETSVVYSSLFPKTISEVTQWEKEIISAETANLLRLDVPRFIYNHNKRVIKTGDKAIITKKELNKPKNRLSLNNIRRQIDWIILSCYPERNPNQIKSNLRKQLKEVLPGKTVDKYLDPFYLTNNNEDNSGFSPITEHISNEIMNKSQISISQSQGGLLEINETTNSLYTGKLGNAVYLTYEREYTDHSYDKNICTYINDVIKDISRLKNIEENSVGKIGEYIYGLTAIGEVINDKELIQSAFEICEKLDAEIIKNDSEYDLIHGSSGLILSLIKLYEITEDYSLINKARLCSDHLIESRKETKTGHLVWNNKLGNKPMIGLTHGTSGIAYALSKLYNITAEKKLIQPIKSAIIYEDYHKDNLMYKWPDFRHTPPTYHGSLSYGNLGVILCRNIISKHVDIPDEYKIEISNGFNNIRLERTTNEYITGSAGVADALIKLGEVNNCPQFIEDGNEIIDDIDRSISQGICLDIKRHTKEIYNHSLYEGVSGVGYMILRRKNRNKIPCLILRD